MDGISSSSSSASSSSLLSTAGMGEISRKLLGLKPLLLFLSSHNLGASAGSPNRMECPELISPRTSAADLFSPILLFAKGQGGGGGEVDDNSLASGVDEQLRRRGIEGNVGELQQRLREVEGVVKEPPSFLETVLSAV